MNSLKEIISKEPTRMIGKYKNVSVLITLIKKNGKYHLLYERRSKSVSQAGDSAFPGGHVEQGETPREAAIRELMEECNLNEENIEIYDKIGKIVTYSRMIIHVFVGEIINMDFDNIVPNHESDELFIVPLKFFMENEPKEYKTDIKEVKGEDFPYHLLSYNQSYRFFKGDSKIHFYTYQDYVIWGFTALMTKYLVKVLKKHNYKLEDN